MRPEHAGSHEGFYLDNTKRSVAPSRLTHRPPCCPGASVCRFQLPGWNAPSCRLTGPGPGRRQRGHAPGGFAPCLWLSPTWERPRGPQA